MDRIKKNLDANELLCTFDMRIPAYEGSWKKMLNKGCPRKIGTLLK